MADKIVPEGERIDDHMKFILANKNKLGVCFAELVASSASKMHRSAIVLFDPMSPFMYGDLSLDEQEQYKQTVCMLGPTAAIMDREVVANDVRGLGPEYEKIADLVRNVDPPAGAVWCVTVIGMSVSSVAFSTVMPIDKSKLN